MGLARVRRGSIEALVLSLTTFHTERRVGRKRRCRVRVVCGRLWVEASENAFYRIFYFFILLLNVLVSFLTARTPTRVSPLVAYLPTT